MTTTPVPQPLGPCTWSFALPDHDEPLGIVGMGADLEPETLIGAYAAGVFPWPHEPQQPIPWFCPPERAVFTSVHASRTLRRVARRDNWTAAVNTAFPDVVAACAERPGHGTWITGEMQEAYVHLHALGWAHSVEVYAGDELAGGLYGVQIGATFTAESMFSRASSASTAALVELAHRFFGAGGQMIDAQLMTPHLRRLGAVDLPRAHFRQLVTAASERAVAVEVEHRRAFVCADDYADPAAPPIMEHTSSNHAGGDGPGHEE